MHGKAKSELHESLAARLIANNSRITRMEFCGSVLDELNVVAIMRLSTTLCVSFSIRSNSCTILSPPVYTSTTSLSSQPSVLPALCLHFYNISVKSAFGSSGSLSTLVQHLRQVSHRFFHLSAYTIYYIVKSALTSISSTRIFSDAWLEPTLYFITTCQSKPVQFRTWAGTFVCKSISLAWYLGSSKIPCYL